MESGGTPRPEATLSFRSLSSAIAVIAVLQGTVKALGWSTVVIYRLLALGFARLRFAHGARQSRAAA
jgi:hypothetical protein